MQHSSPQSPRKSRGTALVLEVLPGWLGLLGVGWLYAGNVVAGLLFLFGYSLWGILNIAAIILLTVLAANGTLPRTETLIGLMAFLTFCTLPISLCIIALSTFLLARFTSGNPDFGR